jgi:hypothetical protein
MIAVAIVTTVVILAVALIATGGIGFRGEILSEREARDRLRPHSGAVESAPQRAPIERET